MGGQCQALTFLLLSVQSVEWAHQSMTADEHYVLVGRDLSSCAPSFAILHVDSETKPVNKHSKKPNLISLN